MSEYYTTLQSLSLERDAHERTLHQLALLAEKQEGLRGKHGELLEYATAVYARDMVRHTVDQMAAAMADWRGPMPEVVVEAARQVLVGRVYGVKVDESETLSISNQGRGFS